MPTVHLVCGPPGAGKTAYARALAERRKGACFSIHEWMQNLFETDCPDPPERSWTFDRVTRCEVQMWLVADQLLARGVDVIFDAGLGTVEQRDRFRTRIAYTRAETKLHYLDIARETRRSRLLAGAVGVATFEALDLRFEPPSDDELHGAMIVCDG